MRQLALGLGLVGCSDEPPTVDWCEVPLPVPVADRVPPPQGLIYEIYVRSFQDTDGDGVGDLAGVAAHLDHLTGLGVSALWLMPIFENDGGAGYGVTNWDAVEPDYGDEGDLDALYAAAEARGMRVLLDAPVNHSSEQHPWFQAALSDPDDPHVLDYLFSDQQWDDERWHPTDDGRYYYAYFAPNYPDLDLTRPDLSDRMLASLGGWLEGGAGGFRVDAVVQLIEEDGDIGNTDASHCWLARMTQLIHSEHPDALLLSEAWSKDPAENLGWLGEDDAPEADLILDVPRRWTGLDAWTTGDPGPVRDLLQGQMEEGASERMASYLSGQDVPRLSATLPDPRARRSAMVLHLLGPGVPILYYGDELDLPSPSAEGKPDEAQRGPMLWDDGYNAGFTEGVPWFSIDQRYRAGYNAAAQAEDPESMLSLVRALVPLRGGETTLLSSGSDRVLALQRGRGTDALVVAINYANAPISGLSVDLPIPRGDWTDLASGEAVRRAGKRLWLPVLPAYGYVVLGTGALATHRVPGALPELPPRPWL